MKLRNKKTGEILQEVRSSMTCKDNIRIYDEAIDKYYTYNSLAELNEEWEDYEEPKTFWAISWAGEPEEYDYKNTPEELKDMAQEIGNYFKTKEEAEKAVEKLKAWKRLKDKGFRCSGFYYTELCDYARLNIQATVINDNINNDLELLFGGEE